MPISKLVFLQALSLQKTDKQSQKMTIEQTGL
jgi:hypothetical protein